MEKYNHTLLPGEIYHVYNRAVGDELLFRNENDYYFFLKKMERFISPIAKIYCYCLLPNHFHILVEMRNNGETDSVHENIYSKAFSNFFNSYARSYNNAHQRKGKLFMLPFKRIMVEDEEYFNNLVVYIHRNPIHHGYATDYSAWKYSSYADFLRSGIDFVEYDEVMEWFGSLADFIEFHEINKEAYKQSKYEID